MWLRTVSLAQPQLLGDLHCRSALLEELEHLRLTGGERQFGMRVRLFHDVRDLPEDTDHVLPAVERYRAHLHCHALAVGVDHHHRRVRDGGRAHYLAREELTGTVRILGGDDRGELASPNVSHDRPRGRVHPADDSGGVDEIARHVDMLEHVFDGHSCQRGSGHAGILCHWSRGASVIERAGVPLTDAWEWIRSRRNPCRETFDRPCLHGSGRAVRNRAARSGARDRGSRRRAGSRAAVRAGRPPGGAAPRVWAGRTVRADGRERSLRRADRRAPRPLESGRPREDRSERQGSRRPLPVPPRFPGQRASARLRLRALGAPDHGGDAADRVRARRLRSRRGRASSLFSTGSSTPSTTSTISTRATGR